MEGIDFTERVSRVKLDLAMRKQANTKKKLIKHLAQNNQMLVPG
jgi:hypothetical protein